MIPIMIYQEKKMKKKKNTGMDGRGSHCHLGKETNRTAYVFCVSHWIVPSFEFKKKKKKKKTLSIKKVFVTVWFSLSICVTERPVSSPTFPLNSSEFLSGHPALFS